MSYFKRFTDFCVGFSLLAALLYLFRQFMAYTPKDDVSLTEKLKLFFSNGPRMSYECYLPLLLLLTLSLVVTLAFHKRPFVCFTVSVLPLLQLLFMYKADRLYERPMTYIVLAAVHSLGCLVECIRRDREDGGRRAALAADGAGLLAIAFGLYILRMIPRIADAAFADLNFFEKKAYFSAENADTSFFWRLAILYAAILLLRWLLRDLYYADAALALIPFGYTLYRWHAGTIPFHGSIFITLAAVYLLARLAVMLSCRPKTAYVRDKQSA